MTFLDVASSMEPVKRNDHLRLPPCSSSTSEPIAMEPDYLLRHAATATPRQRFGSGCRE